MELTPREKDKLLLRLVAKGLSYKDIADRLVLSKIRALFGDQLEFAISAAAPIGADVLYFFNAAGVRVLDASSDPAHHRSVLTLAGEGRLKFGTALAAGTGCEPIKRRRGASRRPT